MTTDPYGRFLTIEEVMASTGMSRAQVYRAVHWRDHPLPPPVKVRTRSYWVEAEIAEWKRKLLEAQRAEESNE